MHGFSSNCCDHITMGAFLSTVRSLSWAIPQAAFAYSSSSAVLLTAGAGAVALIAAVMPAYFLLRMIQILEDPGKAHAHAS